MVGNKSLLFCVTTDQTISRADDPSSLRVLRNKISESYYTHATKVEKEKKNKRYSAPHSSSLGYHVSGWWWSLSSCVICGWNQRVDKQLQKLLTQSDTLGALAGGRARTSTREWHLLGPWWRVGAERRQAPASSSYVSSRVWLWVPVFTLLSLRKTLNHHYFILGSDIKPYIPCVA